MQINKTRIKKKTKSHSGNMEVTWVHIKSFAQGHLNLINLPLVSPSGSWYKVSLALNENDSYNNIFT